MFEPRSAASDCSFMPTRNTSDVEATQSSDFDWSTPTVINVYTKFIAVSFFEKFILFYYDNDNYAFGNSSNGDDLAKFS